MVNTMLQLVNQHHCFLPRLPLISPFLLLSIYLGMLAFISPIFDWREGGELFRGSAPGTAADRP